MPSLGSNTCIYDHHQILLINLGDLSRLVCCRAENINDLLLVSGPEYVTNGGVVKHYR